MTDQEALGAAAAQITDDAFAIPSMAGVIVVVLDKDGFGTHCIRARSPAALAALLQFTNEMRDKIIRILEERGMQVTLPPPEPPKDYQINPQSTTRH